MSALTNQACDEAHDAAESSCRISTTRIVLGPQHGAERKRTFGSLIVWPLVILSLIQVTSHIVSQHDKGPLSRSIQRPSNERSPLERICQADEESTRTMTERNRGYNPTYECAISAVNSRPTRPSGEISNQKSNTITCSSTRKQIPTSEGLLSSLSLTYLPTYVHEVTSNIYALLSQITAANAFGPKILLADAAQVSSNSMYQANHDKEIIVLNSTNFNVELIQHSHPFPHIKLLEYYLEYCGICLRFKPTYVQVAKEIYPWRNVIRASAIDLGVSSNTLIASTWSIDVIPTLRIHPPPSPSLAARFDKQLSALNSKLSRSDQLKSLSDSYNAANLSIGSLGVTKYTYDAKRENLAEKVSLLKLDLVRYIERYVSTHPEDLPPTWPNLRPVKEQTLLELRRNHPRQELFLIVEAGSGVNSSGSSGSDPSSPAQPSLGLQIMLELSSSAASKAIRYVRASENAALIEDVIAHKKRETSEQSSEGQHNTDPGVISNEQVDLLRKLLGDTSAEQQDQIALIHIDDSHSPYVHASNAPSNKFPSITVITKSDLVVVEQQQATLDGPLLHDSNTRTRRGATALQDGSRVRRDATIQSDADKMTLQRRLDLVKQYINHTYIEVQEDREFLKALSSFDENPTSPHLNRDAIEKFQATQQENQISLSQNIKKSKQQEQERATTNSTLKQFLSRLNPASDNSFLSSSSTSHHDGQDDYEDKLKAIRYIFFQEVPRKTLADKSPAEKLEKLNVLINLASVIKAYFPLPDLASVQFIDGISRYLTKQQTLLAATTLADQDRVAGSAGSSFDFRALKQVIKNLEAEGKRLPEIKDWQHCKFSGYPCALWRLFHTLTAFEYKKLSQISQQSTPASQQVLRPQQQQNTTVTPLIAESQASSGEQQQSSQEVRPSPAAAAPADNNGLPVERVVSPPSTTTSLSLTIATPNTAQDHLTASNDNRSGNNKGKQLPEADLPGPVLLVMRDYVTNFFSCEECARNFRQEAMDLTFDRIRRLEPAEFSILWLWETHNRVSKRLSVSADTNPPEHPKKWYPSYDQCPKCYNKPPSYLKDTNVELAAIFHESIDWNREETLGFLVSEFSRQPMDKCSNLFGYPIPYGFNYIIVIGISSLLLIILLRCASCYIERQRRHKASLLNGNGAHYSVELQAH